MATSFRTTTPPPSSRIHTPSTPKFGSKEDNYEPYSPRRKSARVSQRSQPVTTPPRLSRSSPHSPRTTKKVTYPDSSPISSPPTATKKATPKLSPTMGGRRVSGALNSESATSAATALGIPPPKMEVHRAAARSNGMLPTPAKTPKKAQSKNAPAITAVARNLFPVHGGGTDEEIMPSPKKKGRKKYTGFTLDSFGAEDDNAPIPIYTDSYERVPEVDTSADNPFYGQSSMAVPDPTKRSSKRRKITIPGEEEEITVEEAEQREDGLMYTFRGKKLFRKFPVENEDASDDQDVFADDMDTETASRDLHRPLTRSSIKPRLLFPTPQQVKAKEMRSQVTDDEEADTDIESPLTPTDLVDKVATPNAPRFSAAMASPPTTVRATRSKDVDMSSSPAGPTSDDEFVYRPRRGGNHSPFDGWKQTKNVGGTTKKRGGEELIRAKGSKKTRG